MRTPRAVAIAGSAVAIPLLSLLVRKGLLSQDEGFNVLCSAEFQIARVMNGDEDAVEATRIILEAILAMTEERGPPSIWPKPATN